MSNLSILPIYKTLLAGTITGQSGSGFDGNEELLRFPQNSSITGASPSDFLVSYPGHSLERDLIPPVGVFHSLTRVGFWIQNIPPPWLVVYPKLKNPVFATLFT